MEVHSAGANRYFYGGDVFDWFEVKTVGRQKGDGNARRRRAKGRARGSNRTGAAAREAGRCPRSSCSSPTVGSYKVGPAAAVVTLTDGGLVVKLGDQPTLKLIPAE